MAAIGQAFESGSTARVLDLHSDPDHHRAVFTIAGAPGALAEALQAGAREVIERIDLTRHEGVHPRVGAMDVAPVVYLSDATRGAACAEALVAADLLGELGLPVYLYGTLAGGRSRAELRREGGRQLARIKPDAGPRDRHPTAGAVLVGARPPLVAFNVELEARATLDDAKRIAAEIREGGADGLPGVRAIGLELRHQDLVQVSTNVEDHTLTSPRAVVAAIAARSGVRGAELVALAPAAAFADFPDDVPLRGLRTIESALELLDS